MNIRPINLLTKEISTWALHNLKLLRRFAQMLVLLLVVAGTSGTAGLTHVLSERMQPVEEGKFRLHKFEQATGEEKYEISRAGDSLVVHSSFEFTDRGRKVPLEATLRTRQDLTPESFDIKGKISRFASIDTSVKINGKTAEIREGPLSHQATTPERFFTLGGYAPVAMQMLLVRYFEAHGGKDPVQILPGAPITVARRGHDRVTVGSNTFDLERYSINGLIWGREALWFDSGKHLVAAVTVDAEFDHFEAIRDGFEPALPEFVRKAAADGMAGLAEISRQFASSPEASLAIKGGTLIDATGKQELPDSVILMEGDRISAVGTIRDVTIPSGTRVIDAAGKYVLPGLWDMHAHFEQVEWGPVYLAAGVTTARDVGNEFDFITAVRDAIEQGQGIGPHLLLAGIVDGDSKVALGIVRANTPDEALSVVDRYHDAHFQQIKIYSSVKPEVVAAICAEAHRLGMTVTGHIPNGMNAFQGVAAGMDQINHIEYILPVMMPGARSREPLPPINLKSTEAQKAIEFFKAHGTVLDPTLSIEEWSLHPTSVAYSSIEPGAAKVPRALYDAINNTGVPAAAVPWAASLLQNYLTITGALHRAGIQMVAGTDQVVPGHSLHRELELYVQAGFTPLEAIQAATIVPARVMKVANDLGTIEVGKKGDMIIVEGDPLASLSNTRNVRMVITGGRVYDPAQLWKSVGFLP